MSWIEIDEIIDVDMMLAGPPGTGITAAEKIAIDTRLGALEDHRIEDHPGTNVTDPQDGEALVYDTSGVWVNRAVTQGLEYVSGRAPGGAATLISPATALAFSYGFYAEELEAGVVLISPNFGGSPGQFAEGRHLHPVPVVNRYVLSEPSSIPNVSSGSRDLVSANVGPFAVDVPTLVEVRGYVYGEGINDPALIDMYIRIDGTEDSSDSIPSEAPFTWEWGVNAQYAWESSRVITRAESGTSAQTASTRPVVLGVRWKGGAALDIKAAWMVVKRTAYRT